MKKIKKQMLNVILFTLLIAIVACITVGTYAWFTDQKSFSTGELKFGTIKIDVAGDSISGDKLNVAIERSSGELTGNLMPGDTVSLKFNVALASNSEPAYYLVFLTGAENLFDENCFYYNGTNIVSPTSESKTVGSLSTTSHTFNLTKQISTSYEAQGGKVSITLEVYAIQQANLTQEQAYTILNEKANPQPATFPGYPECQSVTALSGGKTSIGFYYKSDTTSLSGYSKDDALTNNLDAQMAEADKGKIEVWKKSDTDIAFVSEGKIYAPENCDSMFAGYTTLTKLDLINFDTSNVTVMSNMFLNSGSLIEILVGDDWVIPEGCNTMGMFVECGTDHVTKK